MEAVEEARVDHPPGTRIGDIADGGIPRLTGAAIFGGDDADHRQAVPAGEVEVPLVVCRAAENGAGAVVHEHEVGGVDRQLDLGSERMQGAQPGVVAELLGRLDRRLAGRPTTAILDETSEAGIVHRERLGQRVVGGNGAEGRTAQGVGARRVDLEWLLASL